jgi:type I restriction enzyme S subunit
MMLPEGWRRSTLGDVARITSGGTPNRSEPSYWGGSIPWVTTGEIQFNTITDTNEKITEAGLKNSSAKLFQPGTLLMAMYGQGKTRGQVAKLAIEASTNQNSAAILLHEGHDPDFYFHFLSWKYDEIRDAGYSGGLSHLNAGLLKQIPVLVAPQKEQSKIAQILSVWDEAVTNAERIAENGRVLVSGLRNQLLSPSSNTTVQWAHVRIGEVLREVRRKTEWNDDVAYPLIIESASMNLHQAAYRTGSCSK